MTDFIKDTIMIDEKLDLQMPDIASTDLYAVMLPFYIEPNSMDLMVVMKRSLLPGSFRRTGKRMGISALTVILPEDEHITIDKAYASLNLPATMQEAIPFGSVMTDPLRTTETFELVLVQIEPIKMIDKKRGIVYQEKGKYEIGAMRFSDIIEGINSQIITDMKTRLLLNELYILAVEQSGKEQQGGQQLGNNQEAIGGGGNLPAGFGDQKGTVKTSDIPDEVIQKNAQKDFGAIYSRVTATEDTAFTTIEKPNP